MKVLKQNGKVLRNQPSFAAYPLSAKLIVISVFFVFSTSYVTEGFLVSATYQKSETAWVEAQVDETTKAPFTTTLAVSGYENTTWTAVDDGYTGDILADTVPVTPSAASTSSPLTMKSSAFVVT